MESAESRGFKMLFQDDQTASERFEKAWYSLLESEPFYAVQMFNLEIIESNHVPTFETDGKKLIYNPEFVQELTLEHIETVDLHELLHVTLFHHLKMAEMRIELGDKFDKIIFNKAADYEVNWIIKNMGRSLPECALYDDKYNGALLRDIYFDIQQQEDDQQMNESQGENSEKDEGKSDSDSMFSDDSSVGDLSADSERGDNGQSSDSESGISDDDGADNSDVNNGNGSDESDAGNSVNSPQSAGNSGAERNTFDGDMGQISEPTNDDGSELTKDQINDLKRDLENEIISAWKFSDKQGKGNPVIDDIVSKILSREVCWEDLVREFLSNIENGDTDWNHFDKRHLTRGMYLPSIEKKVEGSVCFMVDTSASVSAELVKEWEIKINEIISELPYLEILLIFFHHSVVTFEEYTSDDAPISFENTTPGGTDYRPPFAFLNDSGFQSDCILVLTDMECNWFPKDPGIPVLWCSSAYDYSSPYVSEPPFGHVVHLK